MRKHYFALLLMKTEWMRDEITMRDDQ